MSWYVQHVPVLLRMQKSVALPELQSCLAPVPCNNFTSCPDKYIDCHPELSESDRRGFCLLSVPYGSEELKKKMKSCK